MARILVIEDDRAMCDTIRLMLEQRGHSIQTASEGSRAMRWLELQRFDLVITDMLMPGQEGVETIRMMRRRFAGLPILAISGGGQTGFRDALEAARLMGAHGTLSKPFEMHELFATVDALLSPPPGRASAA